MLLYFLSRFNSDKKIYDIYRDVSSINANVGSENLRMMILTYLIILEMSDC